MYPATKKVLQRIGFFVGVVTGGSYAMAGAPIVLSGVAGFIGSHLVKALLARGHHVRILDNFSTGKRENISHHYDNPNFTLIEGDIRDIDDCRKACDGVEYIMHRNR